MIFLERRNMKELLGKFQFFSYSPSTSISYHNAKPGREGERAVFKVVYDDERCGQCIANAAQGYQGDEGGHRYCHVIP